MKVLLSALVFLLLGLSGAAAEKHDQEPVRFEGYIPVQLRSFSIPLIAGDGWLARGPITMFLVVRGQDNVSKLCRYLPRVREAITLTVDQSPVPMVGEKYQLDIIGARLHRAINQALPNPLIVKVHLFPGARKVGAKAEKLVLPGTDENNCLGLKYMPSDAQALLDGKDAVAKTFTVPDPEAFGERKAKPAPPPPPPSKPGRNATPPSIIVQVQKTAMPEKKAPDPKVCRKLDKVWSPSIHKVSGTQYWLDRAFTLDDNHDGAVDNIGFILKAEDKPELYIYYFPGKSRQSVITVPTLRLKDDRKVLNVCFGQAKFEKFKPQIKEEPQGAFQVPNLAEELAAKSEGKKYEAPPKARETGFLDGPGLYFAVAIGAGVLLIGGGGVGYALARRRADRRRKERRSDKERRTGERRQQDEPIVGEDKRDGKNRRQDGDRRGDANRRKKADRRGDGDRRQQDRRA